MSVPVSPPPEIDYPDSDGQPRSDNTLQFEWIVTLKYGVEALFRDTTDVFVAGDLLWYPVEGHPAIRQAPDVLVAFGRPKGYRGSYRQWEEDDVAPQVVFEVWSPGNRPGEMTRKFEFYNLYGVEEYYLIDPDEPSVDAWLRTERGLRTIDDLTAWSSSRLGVRFDLSGGQLRVIGPDGRPFATYMEVLEAQRQAEQRAEQEHLRAERLAARLRELGVDPDA